MKIYTIAILWPR